jgi:hypothetical protein
MEKQLFSDMIAIKQEMEDSDSRFNIGIALVVTDKKVKLNPKNPQNIRSIIEVPISEKTIEIISMGKSFEQYINRNSRRKKFRVEISFVVTEPVIEATH